MEESSQLLARLLSSLPAVGASEDADEQTRAVLSPLVERSVSILSLQEGSAHGTAKDASIDPYSCPNCGGPPNRSGAHTAALNAGRRLRSSGSFVPRSRTVRSSTGSGR